MKLQREAAKLLDELDCLCIQCGISKIRIDGESIYFYRDDGLNYVNFMTYENGEYRGVEESSLLPVYSARTGEGYVD